MIYWSRDTSVGMATGYDLGDRETGVRVPVRSRIFTSPIIQTGSGVHPTSYTVSTGSSFPGIEADLSTPTSAEVNKMWIYGFHECPVLESGRNRAGHGLDGQGIAVRFPDGKRNRLWTHQTYYSVVTASEARRRDVQITIQHLPIPT
jgi:hypothetical protein